MHNKKWFTWLLIIVVFLLPVPALFRFLQAFIVRNAVVTAYIYEVRASIDGIVVKLDAQPGSIPGNSPVVVLHNTRMPHGDIDSLEARYHERLKTHAFFQQELEELNTRLATSNNQLSDYRTMLQQDLDQTVAILKARLNGEEARLHEASQIRMRNSHLLKINALSLSDIERIEADFRQAEAHVQSTRLEQKQIEHRRQMLRNNLFPSDLSDGVLQVQNQINALSMAILDYKRRIHGSETDLAIDGALLQAAFADMKRRSTEVVQLPDSTVIWSVDAREGMGVVKGERILSYIDRNNLMVDVTMDDSTIALIHSGHPVRIRLFGNGGFIDGKVASVLGSAADRPDSRFAAGVKEKSVRDGRVLIRIDDPELYRDVARFCGVGRTAYVEFQGIGLIEQYLGSFLR
ncbi:MAG: HlyD family efflux transporter periplasmic adaptor subunit [Pseudomonadota bacterium]